MTAALCSARSAKRGWFVPQGRVHLYEVHDARDVAAGLRFLTRAGIERLIPTNAAGSVHPDFPPGSWMMMTDDLNLIATTEMNRLRTLGADAIGMSTVCETIQACALMPEVAGFSCLMNWAAGLNPGRFRIPMCLPPVRIAGRISSSCCRLRWGSACCSVPIRRSDGERGARDPWSSQCSAG
jgi:purine nucleoside phosphorylase